MKGASTPRCCWPSPSLGSASTAPQTLGLRPCQPAQGADVRALLALRTLKSSSEIANVQRMLPHERCQHSQVLLALAFPWQRFHSPTDTGAPALRARSGCQCSCLVRSQRCQNPSSEIANVQRLLPHERCQHSQVLLALAFPWQRFHSPTHTGAPALPASSGCRRSCLARSQNLKIQLRNCKRPATAPTRKVPGLPGVAGPRLPLAALSQPHRHWGSGLASQLRVPTFVPCSLSEP